MGKDDHDYRAAQSIAGKGEKLFGRLGIAYQQNGGVYGADQKQLITDITQTDLQYNQSIDILATGATNLTTSIRLQHLYSIIIPNSMVTEVFSG